ncbi:MAG TPA: response regulator [Clostridia bacterium]|nr:response regulator [Clostridia bacterium]
MKVILVDDEPIALELLSMELSAYKHVNIVGCYTDPLAALSDVEELRPDVIFLDIEMGQINGVEVVPYFMETLGTVEIVFITAYSQYAVDAFEVNALDYLLKPVQGKRLRKTMERLETRLNATTKSTLGKHLRINSFGTFQVFDREGNSLIWRTRKSKELFAYLWFNEEKPILKTLIIDDVFTDKDSDNAITLLHTTIYLLRKNLEQLGYSNGIIYYNDCYQLNVSSVSDVGKLDRILDIKKYDDDIADKILDIYKGDLFENEGYHWIVAVQQKYRRTVFNFLKQYAAEQLKNEKLTSVLKRSLDRMYAIDPFSEETVVMMIHYLGKKCDKLGLKTFFEDYTTNLWDELELEPISSTADLFRYYMTE